MLVNVSKTKVMGFRKSSVQVLGLYYYLHFKSDKHDIERLKENFNCRVRKLHRKTHSVDQRPKFQIT